MKYFLLLPLLLSASLLTGQSSLSDLSSHGTNEEAPEADYEVSIFPNPVVHTFIIEVELSLITEKMVSFELFDMFGKRVLFIKRLIDPVEIVERRHLPEGTYSFVLKTREKIIKTGKLMFADF